MSRQKYLNARNSNSIDLHLIYEGLECMRGFTMDFGFFTKVFMSFSDAIKNKIVSRSISELDIKYNLQTIVDRQGFEVWCES